MNDTGFNSHIRYEPVAVTPTQFAEALSVHTATVLRWLKAGKIKAARVDRSWRIPVTEFDRLGMPRPTLKGADGK